MWHPTPYQVCEIVDAEFAHMGDGAVAKVLGIKTEELIAWHRWRIMWSSSYVAPNLIPVAATAAPPLEETVFLHTSVPVPTTNPWVDVARISASGEPVATIDEDEAA